MDTHNFPLGREPAACECLDKNYILGEGGGGWPESGAGSPGKPYARPGLGQEGCPAQGWGPAQCSSHHTGGVRLTASEEGAKGLLPELPLKRLKLPIKKSFSSSIRADHPFLQLNTEQKGLVFPEGTLLCRRKKSNKRQLSNTRLPPGGETIMPGGEHRSARLLT